jgi:hypothetical protein
MPMVEVATPDSFAEAASVNKTQERCLKNIYFLTTDLMRI